MRLIFSAASVTVVFGVSAGFAQAGAGASTDSIVHDLCGKSVAMLGESPLHGFARTLELKTVLVRRLMEECHYNAFFIESGIYDFLNIEKRLKSGQEVTEGMIAAAIGGIWATREMSPLIPFLLEKTKAGKVSLGGLDDQLGRGTYAQRDMPADLVEHLQGDEKTRCLAILRRHMLWQYSAGAPYSAKDKALILGCLDGIGGGLAPSDAPFSELDLAMVESLKRLFARDFRPGADTWVVDGNDRDQSMYANFRWLMARLPAHSKIIVWAATSHVAKDLSAVSGEEGVIPFGSYVRREFKSRAFALGFSAYAGSYAMPGQAVQELSAAPADSLEGQVQGLDWDMHYWTAKDLHRLGLISGRPLGSGFKSGRWGEVVDGMVVFRLERAVAGLKPRAS